MTDQPTTTSPETREQRVTVVIEQTVRHRVSYDIDPAEVLAWAAEGGRLAPALTGELIAEFLRSGRYTDDMVQDMLRDSTNQEPWDDEIVSVEVSA